MNRRNLLIGIGTAAVGTGGVLGSGALTSVEADRTVSVGVNGDSAAALTLDANDQLTEITNGGTGSTLELNLGNNLNDEATTTFGVISESSGNKNINNGQEAFKITNDTGDSIVLSLSSLPSVITLKTDGDPSSSTEGLGTLDTSSKIPLTTGETLYVVVQVDTTGGSDDTNGSTDTNDLGGTITFTATSSSTPTSQ